MDITRIVKPANETSRIELLERDLYIMLNESKRDKKRIKELEAANERLNNHNKSLKAENFRLKQIIDDVDF